MKDGILAPGQRRIVAQVRRKKRCKNNRGWRVGQGARTVYEQPEGTASRFIESGPVGLLNEQPFNPGGVLSDQTSRKFDSLPFWLVSSLSSNHFIFFFFFFLQHVEIAGRPRQHSRRRGISCIFDAARSFCTGVTTAATWSVRGWDTLLEFTPRYRVLAYRDSVDSDILFGFFSRLPVVRFLDLGLQGFRIDFSCGGFRREREKLTLDRARMLARKRKHI